MLILSNLRIFGCPFHPWRESCLGPQKLPERIQTTRKRSYYSNAIMASFSHSIKCECGNVQCKTALHARFNKYLNKNYNLDLFIEARDRRSRKQQARDDVFERYELRKQIGDGNREADDDADGESYASCSCDECKTVRGE